MPRLQTLKLAPIRDMSALTQLPASCVDLDLTVDPGRGGMRLSDDSDSDLDAPASASVALCALDLGHLRNCTSLTCEPGRLVSMLPGPKRQGVPGHDFW